MAPVGWEALGLWGEDTARIEKLAGGVANDVWSVRIDGKLAVSAPTLQRVQAKLPKLAP